MKYLLLLFVSISCFANEEVKPLETYTVTDGYGKYEGKGKTKIQAAAIAREACITSKVEAYEKRHNVVPDADTVDLFIDACINL